MCHSVQESTDAYVVAQYNGDLQTKVISTAYCESSMQIRTENGRKQ